MPVQVKPAIAIVVGAAATGFAATYAVTPQLGEPVLTTPLIAAGIGTAASISTGQILRASVGRHPELLPIAALFAGLGAGGTSGLAIGFARAANQARVGQMQLAQASTH